MIKLKDNTLHIIMLICSIPIIFYSIYILGVSVSSNVRSLISNYSNFQNKELNKLQIQKEDILKYNKFSKSLGSRGSEDYWSILYVDSTGNIQEIEVDAGEVKLNYNSTQKNNYVTFKYVKSDIAYPDYKKYTLKKGYYKVNLFIK